MEEVLMRFHQIGKQIFEELNNQSLAKCREVNETWRLFIEGKKTLPFRIIKSLTNIPDDYLKKKFGKADLASVTELVKNIQHAYSEVHHEQHNFKYACFSNVCLSLNSKQSGPRFRIFNNNGVMSKSIKKCVKRNSDRQIKKTFSKAKYWKVICNPNGGCVKIPPYQSIKWV